MEFEWYPQYMDPDAKAQVQSFIHKKLAKHKELYVQVLEFLRKLKETEELETFYTSGWLKQLSGGLHEMRIPPRRPGGVVRIYFSFNPLKEHSLLILDAELKKDREAEKTDTASKRLTEYQEYLKRRSKK